MTKLTKPKTIVCFGDSNTHGYNSSNDGRLTEQERWTCLLDTYLGDEYRIIEEGLGGRTTVFDDPIFEGLSGLAYLFPCLMSHEPVDLLIIMLGTNDTKERFRATPANIAKGLERLTQKGHRYNSRLAGQTEHPADRTRTDRTRLREHPCRW